MSLWLRNLTEVLDHHPVVILHGNVRDCYLDEAGHLHDNLTTLLRQLARTPQWHINQFVCYDLGDGERTETLQAQNATSKQQPRPIDNDLEATAAAAPIANQRLPPDRVLARWRSQAEQVNTNTFWVVHYLDKLVTYKPSYSGDEQELLLRLEKLIENLRPNHRLLLLALRDTQVPIELYLNSPKVRVVSIPLPDITDRWEFLQFRLKDVPPLLAQLTDGMTLRDLDPILTKLGAQRSSEAIKQAVDRYRFGERDNPWSQLQIETLHRGLTWLRDEQGIQGQDRPIRRVIDTLIRARAGLSGLASGTAAKPKGVLFFAGPTGVGKTLLAKKLAQLLFGAEEAFVRLDMSELKEEHTVSKLIGSPPGYVGSESGGKLTNAVRERPYTVVLCDEIEKAHPHILDIFLQLLEDGRLTDSRGQTTFFTETLVIFTSNIGARTLDSRNRPIDERERLERLLCQQPVDEGLVAQHFIQAVESYFQFEISRPELLNRLGDNIIPFNAINQEAIQSAMIRAHFRRIELAFAEIHRARCYRLRLDDTLVPWLVELLGERIRTFGGRAVTNAIEGKLMTPLAREVLRQEHAGVSNYHFGLKWDVGRERVEVYRV